MSAPSGTTGTAVVTLPTDEQIRITREFAAPPALVWRAWTEPDLIARWWHANRGTVTSIESDVRVGGRWRYSMQAHAGFEVAFHGVYTVVEPAARLAGTEVFEGAPEEQSTVETVFEALDGGRTRVTQLATYSSRAVRDMVLQSGMADGMQDAFDLMEQAALALA